MNIPLEISCPHWRIFILFLNFMGIKNIGLSVVYDNDLDLDLEFRQNKLIFESSTVVV